MRGFARRHTVAAALEWLDAQLQTLEAETVPVGVAAGRVLASAITSDVDVPGFDRATMDGYAVVAASTDGAGSYSRLPLTVIGDSMPGRPFEGSVREGAGGARDDWRADATGRRCSAASGIRGGRSRWSA